MATNKDDDRLGTTQDAGYSASFDFKGAYVGKLNEDGYERFSQFSATPDTTLLFAGPARFTGLGGNTADLTPIGLADGLSFQTSPQLQRLFEIGSNRSFFTRGKSMSAVSFSTMLADKPNILKVATANAYRPDQNVDGPKQPGVGDVYMNLDSEYFAVPFGLMILFKTRGGNGGSGKVLAATYLEYCMFNGYNFSIQSQSPVVMENVGIEFDRPVPVSLS